MRTREAVLVLVSAVCMFAHDAMAQVIATPREKPACEQPPTGATNGDAPDVEYPAYTLTRLEPADIQRLEKLLDIECWEQALRIYFKDGWQAEFVDWIVYIKSDGTIRQAITRGVTRAPEFRGAEYVWAIVFSKWKPDTSLWGRIAGADSLKPRPATLDFSIRTINHERDPFITATVKAITGKLLGAIDPSVAPGRPDSTKSIVLDQMSQDSATASMYVGLSRWSVVENSHIELSLSPGAGQTFPGHLKSVYANMSNASSSLFELGLAAGLAHDTDAPPILKDDTVAIGTKSDVEANLYLLGHLNLVRPRLPRKRGSLGLAVGTNLVGGLLEDIVAGVSLGRLVGGFGLIAGTSWRNSINLDMDPAAIEPTRRVEGRRFRYFIGIDMRF